MTCNDGRQLSAFHDGELDPDERQQVQRHLLTCEPCRLELAQIQRGSQLVRQAPLPALPANALARWTLALPQQARDRQVRRLAEWLTAAAAVLLISCLPAVWTASPSTTSPLGEAEALLLSSAGDESASPQLVLARWIATDLDRAAATGDRP